MESINKKLKLANDNVPKVYAAGASGVDLTNYIQKTDYATAQTAGIVKVPDTSGIELEGDGAICIKGATEEEIDAKTESCRPITPANLDYAVKSVTTNTVRADDDAPISSKGVSFSLDGIKETINLIEASRLQIGDGMFSAGGASYNDSGVAIGKNSGVESGVGIGTEASTESGVSIGSKVVTRFGVAIGDEAYTYAGVAIGNGAKTPDSEYGGTAVGKNAMSAGGGFAGGENAKATYLTEGAPESFRQYIDAVQLGTGNNGAAKTFQVYDYQMMDAEGNIPAERLKNAPGVGKSVGYGNEIFNDYENNVANTVNSHVEGSNNKDRIGNSHVEGINNNSTPLYGFKIISKDVAWDSSTRLSTITLDSVEGIEAGMVYNVFQLYTYDDGSKGVEKYRGNISSIDSANKQVVIRSSEGDSQFSTSKDATTNSPLYYFIVNGGIIGSTQIVDESNLFTTHCEGNKNTSGINAHSEGVGVQALGYASHAEGYNTQALGERAHTEGYKTKAQGHESHAEGSSTLTTGAYSHAEGANTQANNDCSHAEGRNSKANGLNSHAEGNTTIAEGISSHAEGGYSKAKAENAHAEGYNSIASGVNSHAEGRQSEATGMASHAEGSSSVASGQASHAEGQSTKAKHLYSHAEGFGTVTTDSYQHVEGTYNYIDNGSSQYAHITGNGTNADNRSNAYTLDKKGNAWFAGKVKIGGTYYGDAKELATKEYIDSRISADMNYIAMMCGVELETETNKYEKVNKYYNDGLWDANRLKNAVIKKWITENEFKTITGYSYTEE